MRSGCRSSPSLQASGEFLPAGLHPVPSAACRRRAASGRGEYAASVAVDLRHFRSFVVVAEEGNIGRAASRLFITQPALSRQLQHLGPSSAWRCLCVCRAAWSSPAPGASSSIRPGPRLKPPSGRSRSGSQWSPAGRLAVGVAIAGHRDHWFELGEAFTARYPRVEVEIHAALSELLQRQVVGGETMWRSCSSPTGSRGSAISACARSRCSSGCTQRIRSPIVRADAGGPRWRCGYGHRRIGREGVGVQRQDPRVVCGRGCDAGLR